MALVRLNRRPPRMAFPAFPSSPSFPALPAFDEMDNRMSRFIERAFGEPFASTLLPESINWMPPVDITETEKELVLSAELPGVDQKDVDVSLEEGVLTIRGEKTEEKEEKKDGEADKRMHLYERSYGSFSRSFVLPPAVDAASISAKFEKGVLKVHVPKLAEVKPKGRKVEIKST